MKRFIIKCIVLLSPFALMLGFVEYELRQIPNSYSETKAALEKETPEVEALITGSSHTRAAVNTDFLSCRAFNLAYGSQSLFYDTQLVLKYLDSMKNLKLVIFTISYFSLEYQLDKGIERWRAGFYRQVYDIPDENGQESLQLTNYSYIALYSPKVAYTLVLQKLKEKAFGGEQAVDEGRSRDLGIKSEVSNEDGKSRVQLHESMMYKGNIAANVKALERVCAELKARKIAVVFITTPLHETYAARMQAAPLQRMQETIRGLSDKYQIEYFNYMFDQRFSTPDFFNSDHLNPRGAEKFSRILDEDIIRRYVPK